MSAYFLHLHGDRCMVQKDWSMTLQKVLKNICALKCLFFVHSNVIYSKAKQNAVGVTDVQTKLYLCKRMHEAVHVGSQPAVPLRYTDRVD